MKKFYSILATLLAFSFAFGALSCKNSSSDDSSPSAVPTPTAPVKTLVSEYKANVTEGTLKFAFYSDNSFVYTEELGAKKGELSGTYANQSKTVISLDNGTYILTIKKTSGEFVYAKNVSVGETMSVTVSGESLKIANLDSVTFTKTSSNNEKDDDDEDVVIPEPLTEPTPLTAENAKEILGEDWESRTTLVIPEGVTSIKEDAFFPTYLENGTISTSKTKTIIIPTSVTEIESNTFERRYNFSSSDPFSGFAALKHVKFTKGSNLKELPSFQQLPQLESIEIPASVTRTRREKTFSGCEALKTVTFEEGSKLEVLDFSTFYGCTSLESIELPASLKQFSSTIFKNCTSLKSVTFQDPNGWNVYTYNSKTELDLTDPVANATKLANNEYGQVLMAKSNEDTVESLLR